MIKSMKDVPDKTRFRLEGMRLLFQKSDGSVRDRIGLALEYGRSGEHDQALGLYREAAGAGGPGTRAAATAGAAAVFRRMDQTKRAKQLCRQVLRSYPNDAFALNTLGAALRDQRQHDEADAAFVAAKRAEQQGNR